MDPAALAPAPSPTPRCRLITDARPQGEGSGGFVRGAHTLGRGDGFPGEARKEEKPAGAAEGVVQRGVSSRCRASRRGHDRSAGWRGS